MLEYLFVYGTLRRAFDNPYTRILAADATWLGPASVPGQLYRVSTFPGAVLECVDGERIQGEVYKLNAPASVLPTLDEYEGADFERSRSEAILENGQAVGVWIYAYKPDISGKQRIESGDFLAG